MEPGAGVLVPSNCFSAEPFSQKQIWSERREIVLRDAVRLESGCGPTGVGARGGVGKVFWETKGVHGEFGGLIAVELWPE